MSLLEIKKFPEKILKEKTSPVEDIDDHIQRLIDNMIETMYAVRGVGLAANQVGVSRRLCVIDVSAVEGENKPLVVLINPTIIEKEGAEKAEEGCLSLPGYTTMLNRAERVSVQGLDRNGNLIVIEGTGMLSRALQHEIDHLDGLLILDRISPIKREFFKRRFNKSMKSTASKK